MLFKKATIFLAGLIAIVVVVLIGMPNSVVQVGQFGNGESFFTINKEFKESTLNIVNASNQVLRVEIRVFNSDGSRDFSRSQRIDIPLNQSAEIETVSPSGENVSTYQIVPQENNQLYQAYLIPSMESQNSDNSSSSVNANFKSIQVVPITLREDKESWLRVSVNNIEEHIQAESFLLNIFSSEGEKVSLGNSNFLVEGFTALPLHQYLEPGFVGFAQVISESSNLMPPRIFNNQSDALKSPESSSSGSNSQSQQIFHFEQQPRQAEQNAAPNDASQVLSGVQVNSDQRCYPDPNGTIAITNRKRGELSVNFSLSPKRQGTVLPFISNLEIAKDCSNLKDSDVIQILESGPEVLPNAWNSSFSSTCSKWVGACYQPCLSCGSSLANNSSSESEVPSSSLMLQQKIECDTYRLTLRTSSINGGIGVVSKTVDGLIGQCVDSQGSEIENCYVYEKNSRVTVTASPVSPSVFVELATNQLGCSPGSQVCEIVMNRDRQATGKFELESHAKVYTKEINFHGANGRIGLSEAGYLGECDEKDGYRCSMYRNGSRVNFSKSHGSAFVFNGWKDACEVSNLQSVCRKTIGDEDLYVSAQFSRPSNRVKKLYLKTINEAGIPPGLVVRSEEGFLGTCETVNEHLCFEYLNNSNVELRAEPNTFFKKWSEDKRGNIPTINFIMSDSFSITATFSPRESDYVKVYVKEIFRNSAEGRVAFSSEIRERGCLDNQQKNGFTCYRFVKGQDLLLRADTGDRFVGWSLACEHRGQDLECNILNLNEDIEVGAEFLRVARNSTTSITTTTTRSRNSTTRGATTTTIRTGCGDNICDRNSETAYNCYSDCHPVCGNGYIEDGENCYTCPSDSICRSDQRCDQTLGCVSNVATTTARSTTTTTRRTTTTTTTTTTNPPTNGCFSSNGCQCLYMGGDALGCVYNCEDGRLGRHYGQTACQSCISCSVVN
jgi:Divergent InlB B-repeat domain